VKLSNGISTRLSRLITTLKLFSVSPGEKNNVPIAALKSHREIASRLNCCSRPAHRCHP
jgi:hypothetical protein